MINTIFFLLVVLIMLEYGGLEIAWSLCCTYEELAVEPGYRLQTAINTLHNLYYIHGSSIWRQNSVSYDIIVECQDTPLAICFRRGMLHVLLRNGLRYMVVGSAEQGQKDPYTLVVIGSGFVNLTDFYC